MTNEEASKILDTIPTIGEQVDALEMAIEALKQPQLIHCKDCRWGKEVCGNIECCVNSNIPPEYHGYEWFCPNGERRTDG